MTNDPADLYKFKVAGLRNVAMTPPYFHDGAVDALPKAVRIMAKVQLDADLSDTDVNEIVTFLGSLTGALPEGFERAPVLPAAGFAPMNNVPDPTLPANNCRRSSSSWIPQGYGHSIENVGTKQCRILIGFNTGVYETIDLSQWVAGNPTDVLATNFSQPASLFEQVPRKDVFISSRTGRESLWQRGRPRSLRG